MTWIDELVSNRAVGAAAAAWFVAQILKVMINWYSAGHFDVTRMVGMGGMPSSHSALVCALTTSIGKYWGCNTAVFATSLALSAIVMYDATGVRREAGKQAVAINMLFQHNDLDFDARLKELLGHTPSQVMAGAIIGIAIGVLI